MNQEQLEERRGEGERERETESSGWGRPWMGFLSQGCWHSRSPFVECGCPQRDKTPRHFLALENEEEFGRKDWKSLVGRKDSEEFGR